MLKITGNEKKLRPSKAICAYAFEGVPNEPGYWHCKICPLPLIGGEKKKYKQSDGSGLGRWLLLRNLLI